MTKHYPLYPLILLTLLGLLAACGPTEPVTPASPVATPVAGAEPAAAYPANHPYAPSLAAPWGGEPLSAADFATPEDCSGCHPAAGAGWQSSAHAGAGRNIIYQGWLQTANMDRAGELAGFCAGCHTPIGLLAGQVQVEQSWGRMQSASLDDLAAGGVSCGFCHTVGALSGVSDGAYVAHPRSAPLLKSALEQLTPVQQTVYLKSSGHAAAYSRPFYGESAFCAPCHEATNPASGLPVMTTYSEWQASPYNSGDPATTTTCQDCHMGRVQSLELRRIQKTEYRIETSDIENPKSKIQNPKSDLPGLVKSTELTNHSLVADLPAAVEMEIEADCAATCRLAVTLLNSGAGHTLPTGATELRRMWLEVRVTDGTRQEIFRAGQVDPYGDPTPETIIYGTVLGDARGNPTQRFWEAVTVLSDHRLPPQEAVTETFEFQPPDQAAGPWQVTATLNQRQVPQNFAGFMAIMMETETRPEIPTIEVARAAATISYNE